MSQVAIGDLIAKYMAGFNLFGRVAILQHAKQRVNTPLRLATHSTLQQFASSSDDGTVDFDFDLPSTGAIDHIRNLTPVTKSIFDGLQRQYKQDAITVAGVNDQRVLQKIRDELGDVLQQGGTAADFRQAVNRLTDTAGIERLTAFEIDTVFNTNVQKAYAAGRFEQMNEDSTAEALPYWQYWTVGDDRVRPAHAALDQFIAKSDDAVWRKIYPPCGFNCRCSVVPLLQDEALEQSPEAAHDSGTMRLPLIAKLQVPQAGFTNIFGQ